MRSFAPLFIVLTALTACSAGNTALIDLRIATFNIAMGLPEAGQLGRNLANGQEPHLQQVAEILQRVRPDIVVLNEFDYDPVYDAAGLLNEHYLAKSWNGQPTIQYLYSYRGPVNTGVDSGLDLDGNGKTGEPQDAWGYGVFPGQYGMLVLSRFPIRQEATRTFQHFPWSALPAAHRPLNPDGSSYYPDDIWQQLRLSSKSHWDLLIGVNGHDLHFLVHHPTPPVFDGPEDRNGKRNHDENRFWMEYLGHADRHYIVDDKGGTGGLDKGGLFVIAGDLNADPMDGDSVSGKLNEDTHVSASTASAIGQLLAFPLINAACTPRSSGGREASLVQGGKNRQHKGDPAADTADFNDEQVGNLRLDYVLPSRNITVRGCGVFWPARGEEGHHLVDASDHRLVWLDISL
ncbi:MAG: endonuclease/exonuclease/phosphatase family protein [Proteobacteria bacterium]|nr:endonuclease/exonuclease/phosphatase family protein [Pseudomonadota bacterium]